MSRIIISCKRVEKEKVFRIKWSTEPAPKPSRAKWYDLAGVMVAALVLGFVLPGCRGYKQQEQQAQTSVSEGVKCGDHYYVDLGLPSGTWWATTNVGASSPSDYGNYYAWGETSTKSSYTWKNLKYCPDSDGDKFSKFVTDSEWGNVDGKDELDPSDDAAYVNRGSSWRMPSKEQLDELNAECEWTWTMMDGHEGYKVVGPNGNSLFLPAAGSRYGSELGYVGSRGFYWSRSLCTGSGNCAYCLYFTSGKLEWAIGSRSEGFSIRAVLVP